MKKNHKSEDIQIDFNLKNSYNFNITLYNKDSKFDTF